MTTADVARDDGVMGPRADRPKRRVFTAEYKAAILAEYDAAGRGQRGVILRRERLYHSHLIEWRKARDDGGLSARVRDPRDAQIAALTSRAAKAEAELARSKAALELIGKVTAYAGDRCHEAESSSRLRMWV